VSRKRRAEIPALSEAEWKVMRALWRLQPATARALLGALAEETGWAYTTLKTMLTRLVEKRAVAEERHGGASVYRALVREEDARGSAVQNLLERAFDGAFGSLVHFMAANERLSASDRAELARLLEQGDPPPRVRRKKGTR
jgi:BlaI family transcriptional regulator, penicillinase repressor